MLTGWQKIGSYWYFLRPARDGNHPEESAATGWIRDDLYWYYLNPEKKGRQAGMLDGARLGTNRRQVVLF